MAVDGTYNIEVNSPMGAMSAKLILESDRDTLSGTVEGQMGLQSFTGGTADGDKVSWGM